MKLEEIAVELNKQLEVVLNTKGYLSIGTLKFEKPSSFGKDRVSFNVKESASFFSVQAIHSRKYNRIEDFWYKYYELLEYGDNYEVLTLSFVKTDLNPGLERNPDLRNLGSGREKLVSIDDINSYVVQLSKEMVEWIEPFLLKTEEIKFLDTIINKTVETIPSNAQMFTAGTEFWFKRIIVAKLANNPDYEEIYLWIRARFSKGFEEKGFKKYLDIVKILDRVYFDLKALESVK